MRPDWLWIAIGIALGLVPAATWVMIGRNASAPSAATANLAPAQPSMLEATPARPNAVSVPPPPAAASTDAQTVAEIDTVFVLTGPSQRSFRTHCSDSAARVASFVCSRIPTPRAAAT